MKPRPSKNSVRNCTRNQNVAIWKTYEMTEKEQAIQASKKEYPHLKDKPIKYDLKR
jgi:hypothetical protein